jgi:DNA polymerase III sliding clamp (beta) subunit (PCNA family)
VVRGNGDGLQDGYRRHRFEPEGDRVKFSTTAAALRDALTTARHAVSSSASTVAQTGVLLQVKSGQLAVIGTDGEMSITALVPVSASKDGQVLLPPRPVGGYLATLPADCPITVTAGAVDVAVAAGDGSPYRFRPIEATFSQPLQLRATPVEARLERLGAALAAVRAAVPRENPGVKVISGPDGLFLYATDRYRVAKAHLPEAGFGDFSGVVPLSVLDRAARSGVTHVAVDGRGRAVKFSGDRVVITSRLIATQFPAVESVLENVPDAWTLVPVGALLEKLTPLASIAADDPLLCTLFQDRLTLSVRNADTGSGDEHVELERPVTAKFEFGMKHQYIVDGIGAHDVDHVKLGWTTPIEPIFVTSSQPFPVTTMMMPMRMPG